MRSHRRIELGPGQESVWDYPRPPKTEACEKQVQVIVGGLKLADTCRAVRVLETSHPPVFYIPPQDIKIEYIVPGQGTSFCEWKGAARYFSISFEDLLIQNAAWCYQQPVPEFAGIRDYLAFYPSKVEACYVGEERVHAQEGDFYGGWITSDIVGPFKGAPGTWRW